ncbi:splicing factor Yju2p [Trichomonascus vanleenenianus]|uniref:mRNA splicing protein YJU2 n=1 Tax=Trichomonascus vanleenenianus TaxID=2268995 RepID=UPI003ECB8153
MSERKTLNKYIPPDYDPSNEKKRKKAPGSSTLPKVRLMAPFTMICLTCNNAIIRNTKFNAKKQVTGESYYNVKVIRFYIRCPTCSAEIRFKTDPKNSSYQVEYGAKREFTPWRDEAKEEETMDERLDRIEREQQEDEEKRERERMYGPMTAALRSAEDSQAGGTDGEQDVMKQLEERAAEAQKELEVENQLEALRARNARIEMKRQSNELGVKAQPTAVLDEQDAADEELARNAFKRDSNGAIIRSVDENASQPAPTTSSIFDSVSKPIKKQKTNTLGIVTKKKKKKITL